ncbi:MAG TPA: hypothetical protein VIV34_09255 [Pseudolabrys sp.]
MKHEALSLIFGATIAFGISGAADHAAARMAEFHHDVMLSAATKHSSPRRQRHVPGQIACTIYGCHPIPPGCHPEAGYNWDGIPTGFDIVVCRPPRGRGG